MSQVVSPATPAYGRTAGCGALTARMARPRTMCGRNRVGRGLHRRWAAPTHRRASRHARRSTRPPPGVEPPLGRAPRPRHPHRGNEEGWSHASRRQDHRHRPAASQDHQHQAGCRSTSAAVSWSMPPTPESATPESPGEHRAVPQRRPLGPDPRGGRPTDVRRRGRDRAVPVGGHRACDLELLQPPRLPALQRKGHRRGPALLVSRQRLRLLHR